MAGNCGDLHDTHAIMNSNRVFIALAAGLLTVPETRLADAWDRVEGMFRCDASELDTGIGAAVGEGGKQRIPLRQWIERQRAQGVVHLSALVPSMQECQVDCDEEDLDEEDLDEDDRIDARPPHMMAGFAGGLPMLLRLSTGETPRLYAQGTVTGPRQLLTARLFASLVARQARPGFYWQFVLDQLNQFFRCNGRDEIAADSLVDHLCSQEGERDWLYMGDGIFRETQVEALTHGEPFVIPPEFAHLVEAVTPFVPNLEPPVWLDIDNDEVCGEQLLRLVEAQPFSARIWQVVGNRSLLEDVLQGEYDLDDFPDVPPASWPGFLRRLPADDVWTVRDELVEITRLECESRRTQPVIPDALSEVFGPDEEDRRRLHFRHRLQNDLGWWSRANDHPSMLFVLDQIDRVASFDAMPLGEARRAFVTALQAVSAFARRVQSPFVTAFDLALLLAAHAEGETEPDLTALQRSLSDRFGESWESVALSVAPFRCFGWGADRLLGLAAISAADVFGGMGSWNDQGFTDGDEARFHAVSEALFTALNRYFESILSFEAREQG